MKIMGSILMACGTRRGLGDVLCMCSVEAGCIVPGK